MELTPGRVVAFLGPYISVISGAVATWLLTKVHVLSLFNLGQDQIAQAITQVIVFGVTAGVVWAGHHKWLTGWQKYEEQVVNPQEVRKNSASRVGAAPKLGVVGEGDKYPEQP